MKFSKMTKRWLAVLVVVALFVATVMIFGACSFGGAKSNVYDIKAIIETEDGEMTVDVAEYNTLKNRAKIKSFDGDIYRVPYDDYVFIRTVKGEKK